MPNLAERLNRTELSGGAAIGAAAALIAVMFMLSTIATPLYGLYQQRFGFSQLTLTLIYASYVVGNLVALLVFGRLADQIGRRVVALPALVISALAALLFLFAASTAWLFWARALGGLGVGLAVGAGTAWLAELDPDKARAARITTSTNFVGLAAGALLAGALSQFAPWPTELVFVVYLALLVGVAVLMLLTPETVEATRPPSLDTFTPRLSLPAEIRVPFIAPAVTVFNAMAITGFYAALIPTVLASQLHQQSRMVAGAVFAELALVVSATIVVSFRLSSRAAMLWGLGLLLPALAAIVAAQLFASMPLLLLASAIAGVSGGLGYRGSLEVINTISPADRRSEIVSSLMQAGFTGNAVPVIGVGLLSGPLGELLASTVFAGVLAVFAICGLVIGLRFPAGTQ